MCVISNSILNNVKIIKQNNCPPHCQVDGHNTAKQEIMIVEYKKIHRIGIFQ